MYSKLIRRNLMHGNPNLDERKKRITEKMSKIKHRIAVMSGLQNLKLQAYSNPL